MMVGHWCSRRSPERGLSAIHPRSGETRLHIYRFGSTSPAVDPFLWWIHHFAATDYALVSLATAQQFLR